MTSKAPKTFIFLLVLLVLNQLLQALLVYPSVLHGLLWAALFAVLGLNAVSGKRGAARGLAILLIGFSLVDLLSLVTPGQALSTVVATLVRTVIFLAVAAYIFRSAALKAFFASSVPAVP